MYLRRLLRRRRRRTKKVRDVSHHYRAYKEYARTRILTRLAYWNTLYGHTYGRVAIKNQTSRWGSCSSRGNLNFNYRIAFLPEELMDYVLVHELCHLAHLNHSRAFWDCVAEHMPDFALRKAALRRIRLHGYGENREVQDVRSAV